MASDVAFRPDWTRAFSSSQAPLMIETQLLSPSPSALQQDHRSNDTPNFLNPFTTASTLSPTAHTMPQTSVSPSSSQTNIERPLPSTTTGTARHSPLPPLPLDDGDEDAVIMEAKEVIVQHCRPSKPRLISIEQDSEKSPTRTEMAHGCCVLQHQPSRESIDDPRPRRLKRSITENEALLHAASAAASANNNNNNNKPRHAAAEAASASASARPVTAALADMRHTIQDEMPLDELRSSLAHKQSFSALSSCHRQASPLSHQWSPNSPESSPDMDGAPPERGDDDDDDDAQSPAPDADGDGGDLSKPPSRRPKPPKPPRLQISTDFHTNTVPPPQPLQQRTTTPAEKFYKHPIKSASRALFSSSNNNNNNKQTAEEATWTPPPSHPLTPLSPRNIKSLFGLSRKKSHSMKNDYPSPVDSQTQTQTQAQMRADSPDVILESPTTDGIPSPPLSAGLVRKHSIAMSVSSKKSSSRLSSAFFARKKTALR